MKDIFNQSDNNSRILGGFRVATSATGFVSGIFPPFMFTPNRAFIHLPPKEGQWAVILGSLIFNLNPLLSFFGSYS